jgi:Alginate export
LAVLGERKTKVTPSNAVADPFDFRQGYVDAGALEGNGIKLRVGRQDLTFGPGRLVATGDWSISRNAGFADDGGYDGFDRCGADNTVG